MIASHLYINPATECSNKKIFPAEKHQVLLVFVPGEERDLLAGYLHDIADVILASNDQEAISILETRSLQLIIANRTESDHTLCTYLKHNPRYGDIPIVQLIPRDAFAIRLQCLESGVDAWLEKPVSRHLLLAQIRNLLANRIRIREHLAATHLPRHPAVSPAIRTDETLWKKLNQVILLHLSDTTLDIDKLAQYLYVSRPTLYRKIAEMSNMSPSELITLIRLHHAAALLSAPDPPIGDVARMSGFATRSGFGKAFHKRYHMTPTEYRHEKNLYHRSPILP